MELVLISGISFATGFLTFFSGFGLNTLLLPVYVCFFPVNLALAQTAVVHLLNNLTKCALVGKYADRKLMIQFGFPAVCGSVLGAFLFIVLDQLKPLWTYTLHGKSFEISVIKITVGILILVFLWGERALEKLKITLSSKQIVIGGIFSGFFGGLSGYQGALRTSFLVGICTTKEILLGTGVIIAVFVDVIRIPIYVQHLVSVHHLLDTGINTRDALVCSVLFATLGTLFASKLFKKITLQLLHTVIHLGLVIVSLLLIVGLI